MVRTWKSWSGPVLLVVSAAIWGIPRMSHYQDWMPYGYDLGGMALIVLYGLIGFASLGLHGLVMGGFSWKADSLQARRVIKMGAVALSIGFALMWCYGKLMDFTLMVPCCNG